MGLLDGYSLGGLLAPNPAYAPTLPENRMLGVADYSGVQPGYAQPGPTNAGPLYDAATAFLGGMKAAPGAYLQQHQDFMNGLDPNTGQPAVSGYDRLNTLAHYFTANMGPQSVGGMLSPVEGALGAGPMGGWHASPHSFDRFDWWNHMGAGEGNQAYGQGGYFAGAQPVGKSYYDMFAKGDTPGDMASRVLSASGFDKDAAIAEIESRAANASPAFVDRAKQAIDAIRNGKTAAHMYEVAIHADPATLLDWHAPLNKQSDYVRSALKDAGLGGPLDHGASVYQQLSQWGRPGIDARGKGAAAASQYLNDAGIPGISYLDGLSRSIGTGTLGQGTRNTVMFDPARIEILRKYGLLGGVLGGGLLGGEQQ